MKSLYTRTLRGFGKGWVALLLGLIGAACYAVWILSAESREQLNDLATAPGDNLQWTIAQLEVEFLALRFAVESAVSESEPDLRTVRRRFDVLYSRATIINSARAFRPVRDEPSAALKLARINEFLDEFVPVIDGPDDQLAAALPVLRQELEALQQAVRETTLAGVEVYSAQAGRNRERAAETLFDLSMLVLGLFLLLLGVVLVLAVVAAITRRQNSEIEQTRSRLSSIVATSLDGIVAVGPDNRVVEFNAAAERIFGFTRAEAIGRNLNSLILPKDRATGGLQDESISVSEGMIGPGLVRREARRKNGELFPVEVSSSVAESQEGQLAISFVRDVSDRVAAEAELVQARDKAVRGEKAKADILAVMSHEMRTPLNGLLGTLDLLQTTSLDSRQRRFVDVMETSGQALLRHVTDVLEISRMDADAAAPVVVAFDPVDLTRLVAESLRGSAEIRGNTVSVRSMGLVPELVCGDRGRIEQVLLNLVGNAVKFTENGKITIEIEALAEPDLVEWRVIDTGIGIHEEDLDRVFDDFVTLDATYSRSVEGTGLGLGIARRLVSILGGEIGVESEPGEGTVFWFHLTLPKAIEGVAQDDEMCPPQTDGALERRVLVVEDNEINRLVAREMLVGLGCDVIEATDGIDGVAMAGQVTFDLIFMDINMPRMDGVTAVGRIRGASGPNRTTAVVAMTAHALPEDLRRFRDAGFADVIVKPLSRARLTEVLARIETKGALAGSVDAAEDELKAVLGTDMAARMRVRGIADIRETVDMVASFLSGGDGEFERDAVLGAVHKAVGLAALLGLGEAHLGLSRLRAALDEGGGDEMTAAIGQVRASLEGLAAV